MPLVNRWIIEARYSPGTDTEWDILGSVMGPRTSERAIAKARESIPAIKPEMLHRATEWRQASEAQREAAAYEDEMDNRGIGGVFAPRPDARNVAIGWEQNYLAGNLPIGVNTPARAWLHAFIIFGWRIAKVAIPIALVVLLARACMHR